MDSNPITQAKCLQQPDDDCGLIESTFSSIHSFTLPKYKVELTTCQVLGIKFYVFEDYLNFPPVFHCFSNLSSKMPLKCQSVSRSVVSLRLNEL